MKEIMILLKKDFDRSFAFLSNPKLILKDRRIKNALVINGILLAILIFFYLQYGKFLSSIYSNYVQIGMGPMIIHSAFIMSVVVICLLSIGVIAGEVFFSSDVDILLRFPIRPVNILFSKLIFLVIGFGVVCLFFLLPLFMKYYEITGKSVLFALPATLAVLAHVAMVLSIFQFIVIFVMSYLNRIPRIKNILQFLGLAFILLINFYLQFRLRSLILQKSIMDFSELLYAYRFYLPQLLFIDKVIQSASLLEAFGFGFSILLISVLCLFVFAHLSTKFMLKGIFANKVSIKTHNAKSKPVKDGYRQRSALMELALKDIREMFKVPIYFFNVSVGAFMPMIFLALAFFQEDRGQAMEFVVEVRKFFDTIALFDQVFFGMLIGFFLAMIIGTMQQSAVSSITREGRRIWLIKALPISYRDQINGRILGSMIFQVFGLMPSTLVIFYIIFPSIGFAISYFLSALIGAWFISNAGLMMDVMAPKLIWDTPQQAIKQNFKIALFVLLSWAYLFCLFFFSSKFYALRILEEQQMKILAVIAVFLHFVVGYAINRMSIRLISKNLMRYEA